MAPDIVFMKDTNGDDKADVTQVLMTGWGKNDTHSGPSNLIYGFDNKIWGTVGLLWLQRHGQRERSSVFRMGYFISSPMDHDFALPGQKQQQYLGAGRDGGQ